VQRRRLRRLPCISVGYLASQDRLLDQASAALRRASALKVGRSRFRNAVTVFPMYVARLDHAFAHDDRMRSNTTALCSTLARHQQWNSLHHQKVALSKKRTEND